MLLASLSTFAQVNDSCVHAITLPVNLTCISDTFSSVGATGDGTTTAPNPGCGFYQGGDVWFKFVVPASGNFRVEVRGISYNPQWALYTGVCGTMSRYLCSQLNGDKTITDDTLGGQTIYIRVFGYSTPNGGNFRVCVWEPEIPVNNDCADAIALPALGVVCMPDTFTNAYSTGEATTIAPNPTCGFYQGADVWFTAVVPASGVFRVETTTNFSQNALYTGTCGNLNQFACSQLDGTNTYVFPNLAGQTIYIRVFSYSNEDGGQFTICLWEPELPVNDSCANAIALPPIGTTCTPDTFTNAFATPEGTGISPNPTCGFYQGADVWFTVELPASGVFRLETTTNFAQTALYSGTCGNLTQFACSQLDGANTYLFPDLAGETIYIRAFSYSNEDGGQFSICLWEPELPVNDSCADAIALPPVGPACSLDTFTNAYSNPEGVNIAPNPTCGFYNGADVWFTAVVPTSGALRVQTTTNFGQNALYTGTCGNLTQFACSQLDGANTYYVPDLAGQTIYIRVFSYSNEDGGEFSICIWEPEIPANDFCADAFVLPVGNVCTPDTFTNAYATNDSSGTAPSPGCGFYSGGDVWFKLRVPQTGNLLIERENISGVNAQFALYDGNCGNFSVISCAQLRSSMYISDTSLANDTVYLRVFNYSSEEGGVFSLCAYDTTCGLINTYNVSETICFGDTFMFGNRTLTNSGFYTETFAANNLCDSIVNLQLSYDPASIQRITTEVCDGDSYTFADGSTANNITQTLIDTTVLLSLTSCDTFIITTILVQDTFLLFDTAQVCPGASYTFHDGTTNNNITTDIQHVSSFTTYEGCDSTIVTTVNVLSTIVTSISGRVCEGESYMFPDGDVLTNISVALTDTSVLQASGGCDSLVITSLSVDPVYWHGSTYSICSGDDFTFPDGDVLTNITVALLDTSYITSQAGCDSVIVTEILVQPSYLQLETVSVCPGDDFTFPDGSVVTNITTSIIDTAFLFTNQWCDSVIVTDLTVAPTYWQNQNASVCSGDSYTLPDGTILTNILEPVTDTSYLLTEAGCDSIIAVTVAPTIIDTTVNELGTDLLVDSTLGATYQWIDCNTGDTIAGASNQQFTPAVTGDYAVIVSSNGCSDTSGCHNIIVVGVEELPFSNLIVYPNPTSGQLNIELGYKAFNTIVSVTDLLGKQVYHKQLNGQREHLLDIDGPQGIYLLHLDHKDKQVVMKIIKY